MKQSLAGDQVLVQLCTEFDVPGLYNFLAETVSATLILLTEQLLDRSDAEARGFALSDGKLPGVSVRLSAPEPGYYSAFASQLPVRFDYGQPEERSEEHTSELQSRPHLVCRLLLEKKKKKSS